MGESARTSHLAWVLRRKLGGVSNLALPAIWHLQYTFMALFKGDPAAPAASGKVLRSLGLANHDVLGLIKALKSGLPFARLAGFAKRSGLSLADISEVLQIPPRTLARRRAQGSLTALESERLVRLAGLFDKAVELFEGDPTTALIWLRTPAKALGNQSPLELAQTEIGARAVEDLIGRLEFGVYP
jgi:putative toxin-antitoxin system antitoxin component (TIGR02293 family)